MSINHSALRWFFLRERSRKIIYRHETRVTSLPGPEIYRVCVSCDGENSFLALIGKLSQSASVFRRGDNWFSLPHPREGKCLNFLFTGISLVCSLSLWTTFRSHPERREREKIISSPLFTHSSLSGSPQRTSGFSFSSHEPSNSNWKLVWKKFPLQCRFFPRKCEHAHCHCCWCNFFSNQTSPRAPLLIGNEVHTLSCNVETRKNVLRNTLFVLIM